MKKIELPVHKARAYLEPGPVVIVTSAHHGARNAMTMGWHCVMDFSPSLIGCVIAASNYSFDLIRDSGVCAINLPTADMVDTVVAIGNRSGRDSDKFETLELRTESASTINAPLLSNCFAHFECRLVDDALVERYNFFIFEIIAAKIAPRPKNPTTLHYTGDGVFVQSGRTVIRRHNFRPALLGNGR